MIVDEYLKTNIRIDPFNVNPIYIIGYDEIENKLLINDCEVMSVDIYKSRHLNVLSNFFIIPVIGSMKDFDKISDNKQKIIKTFNIRDIEPEHMEIGPYWTYYYNLFNTVQEVLDNEYDKYFTDDGLYKIDTCKNMEEITLHSTYKGKLVSFVIDNKCKLKKINWLGLSSGIIYLNIHINRRVSLEVGNFNKLNIRGLLNKNCDFPDLGNSLYELVDCTLITISSKDIAKINTDNLYISNCTFTEKEINIEKKSIALLGSNYFTHCEGTTLKIKAEEFSMDVFTTTKVNVEVDSPIIELFYPLTRDTAEVATIKLLKGCKEVKIAMEDDSEMVIDTLEVTNETNVLNFKFVNASSYNNCKVTITNINFINTDTVKINCDFGLGLGYFSIYYKDTLVSNNVVRKE